MKSQRQLSDYLIIIWIAAIATVAATPTINKDALIIPKVVAIFLGTIYLLPNLVSRVKSIKPSKLVLLLSVIILLMAIQLCIVMLSSNSPFEQQLFGRTGRGLGIITWYSILLLTLASAISINNINSKKLLSGLGISGLFAITYSIFQSFGLDFFPWDSKTNGVIGTLGNPNFVSSFTSMVSLPLLIYVINKVKNKNYKLLSSFALFLVLSLAIYRAESTQGYLTAILAFTVFLLIYIWYLNKYIFGGLLLSFTSSVIVAVAGTLNIGPLSSYLYKVSVQSRGEFWSSAYATANAHPIFGVGLDSFGDYSLKYRTMAIVNEYTDSAHNYFLDYAANAGYIFMFLNILLIILTLKSFIKLQRSLGRFEPFIASLFAAFVVFLAQSLISPISIPIILWGFIISGSIVGLASSNESQSHKESFRKDSSFKLTSILALVLGALIIFPYVNTDRLQLVAMNNGNGDLAMKVATMYPESTVRYSVLGRALLESGLAIPALDLARSAIEFNPHSPALWALILINQSAPIEERQRAYKKLLELDPINKEVINFKF